MNRLYISKKAKQRKKELGLTINNLAKLTQLGDRTITRFFAGEYIKLTNLEKIINILGLDIEGNEIVDIKTLKEKRAKEKAIYIVSLVQATSSLEQQGLDNKYLEQLIKETKEQFLTGEYKKQLWVL